MATRFYPSEVSIANSLAKNRKVANELQDDLIKVLNKAGNPTILIEAVRDLLKMIDDHNDYDRKRFEMLVFVLNTWLEKYKSK